MALTVSLYPPIFKRNLVSKILVVHTLNPSTWQAEAGGFRVCSRPAWSTEQDLGIVLANDETLSQRKEKPNQINKQKPLTSMQNVPPVSNMLQVHPLTHPLRTHPYHLPPQPHLTLTSQQLFNSLKLTAGCLKTEHQESHFCI